MFADPIGLEVIDDQATLEGAVALARSEGKYYFSWRKCREDYWWRSIHDLSSRNVKIAQALATVHLAFALPNSDFGDVLNGRKCVPLSTRPSCNRKIECDACISVYARPAKGNLLTSWAPPVFGNTPESEKRIVNDIVERGAVIFAEMQQEKEVVQRQGNGIDKLPGRMETYASSIAVRDHGLSVGEASERAGKASGDELPRPIVGVGYMGYGDIAKIEHRIDESYESASGRAFAYVNLGSSGLFSREVIIGKAKCAVENEKGFKDLSSEEQEKAILAEYERRVESIIMKIRTSIDSYLSAFSVYTKRMVVEAFAIFSMSHLFTPAIVGKFLPVIKEICKILEVNMESISSRGGWSEAEARDLIGTFRRLQQAQKEAQQAQEEGIQIGSIEGIFKMTKRVDYETFADIVENPGFRLPVLQKLRERKRVSEGCLNEIKSNFREVDYGEYVIQQSKARIFDFNEFVNVVPFAFWRDVCSRILENQIDDLSQVINSMEDLFKKINGYADNLKKGKKEEVGFDSFCKVFPEPATHLFAYKELRESGVDEEILSQVKRELFKKEEEDKTKR